MNDAHLILNRIILLVLGLWPYHQTSFTRFHSALFSTILTSFVGCQFMGLLTIEHKPQLIIKGLSNALFFMICAIKYNSFWINIQAIKLMMENIECICNNLKNEHEIAIVEKYGNIGARYAAVFISCGIFFIFGLLCLPYWPYILQAFLSINISQSVITSYFVTEYFIDEEKSFYLAMVHLNVACIIGILSTAAVGSLLIMYIEHICGMFKIACYRIDQAMMVNPIRKNSLGNIMMIYRKLILAIDMHRDAIKFCEFLFSTIEKPYFFLILILVSCISLQYYQIFQAILLSGQDISELLLHLCGASILLVYLFISNYMGQQVTDHNNCVYLTAYNVQWYKAPLSIQRMMLFILQRGSRELRLNIAGIFLLSMECCASLMSASLSYFTFVYTTQ